MSFPLRNSARAFSPRIQRVSDIDSNVKSQSADSAGSFNRPSNHEGLIEKRNQIPN